MLRLDQRFREARQTFRFPVSGIRNPTEQRTIDIVATETRIAICCQHFKDSAVQFENRNVEGAAAEIVDGDLRAPLQLVETDGVSRAPFASAMRIGNPVSITPMSELVVPRSIPTISFIVARCEIRDA